MQRIKRFIENKSIFAKPEYLKLNNICFRNYIWNKCILGKKEWKLVFKGKCPKKVMGVRTNPKFKIIINEPNEIILYKIMQSVGLEIFDEELTLVDTIYFIREN